MSDINLRPLEASPNDVGLNPVPGASPSVTAPVNIRLKYNKASTIHLLSGNEPASTYFGILKRWNGTRWVKEKIQVRISSLWAAKPLYIRNNGSWREIDITGW